MFYNKQIYVQHARVITFDKEPKLQIEWNKKKWSSWFIERTVIADVKAVVVTGHFASQK